MSVSVYIYLALAIKQNAPHHNVWVCVACMCLCMWCTTRTSYINVYELLSRLSCNIAAPVAVRRTLYIHYTVINGLAVNCSHTLPPSSYTTNITYLNILVVDLMFTTWITNMFALMNLVDVSLKWLIVYKHIRIMYLH